MRQRQWPREHPKTKTLGYGLNVGKSESHFEAYVLLFLLRRLVLAETIVFSYESVSLGVCLFLAFSLANISLLSRQELWDNSWIAVQHFVNECFLSLLALIMVVVSNGFLLTTSQADGAGITIISLVGLFIVFNWAMVIYDFSLTMLQHCRRRRNIFEHRKTRLTSSQVNKVT